MRTLHNIAIHKYIAFIQSAQYITDWVQLPTKTEMDIYRKKVEEPSHKHLPVLHGDQLLNFYN